MARIPFDRQKVINTLDDMNKKKSGGFKFPDGVWKPTKLENKNERWIVRLLHYEHYTKEDFEKFSSDDGQLRFPELYFHYINGLHLCPEKNWGDDCPVCQFIEQQIDDMRNNNKYDKEYFKQLMGISSNNPTQFTPVLVRYIENDNGETAKKSRS